MKIQSLVIGALLAAASVPASAVTLVANFGAGAATQTVSASVPFFSLDVSAVRFTPAPNTLTNISQVVAGNATSITRSTGGLGVAGGGDGPQVDTNVVGTVANPLREAFLITGNKAFYLTNLRLTAVDANDTLQIYGVRTNGTLRNFTYGTGNLTSASGAALTAARAAGTIMGGAGGSLSGLTTSGVEGGTASFGTGIVSGVGSEIFSRYLLTTRVGGDVQYLGDGGQGYKLSGLTATVPEPATWAMLMVGFGLVGFASRRRSTVVAA